MSTCRFLKQKNTTIQLSGNISLICRVKTLDVVCNSIKFLQWSDLWCCKHRDTHRPFAKQTLICYWNGSDFINIWPFVASWQLKNLVVWSCLLDTSLRNWHLLVRSSQMSNSRIKRPALKSRSGKDVAWCTGETKASMLNYKGQILSESNNVRWSLCSLKPPSSPLLGGLCLVSQIVIGIVNHTLVDADSARCLCHNGLIFKKWSLASV